MLLGTRIRSGIPRQFWLGLTSDPGRMGSINQRWRRDRSEAHTDRGGRIACASPCRAEA
jgi:hypothetical protein